MYYMTKQKWACQWNMKWKLGNLPVYYRGAQDMTVGGDTILSVRDRLLVPMAMEPPGLPLRLTGNDEPVPRLLGVHGDRLGHAPGEIALPAVLGDEVLQILGSQPAGGDVEQHNGGLRPVAQRLDEGGEAPRPGVPKGGAGARDGEVGLRGARDGEAVDVAGNAVRIVARQEVRRGGGLPQAATGGDLVAREALQSGEVGEVRGGGRGGAERDLVAAEGLEGLGVALLLDCWGC